MKYANIIVDISVEKLDKTFQYSIPENLQEEIQVGVQVDIPFGNRKLTGYVIELTEDAEFDPRRIRSDGSGLGDQRVCTGNDLATGDSDLRGDGEPGTEDEVLRQYRILTGGRNAGFVSAGGSCDVADRMESRVRRGSDLSVCDVSYLDHWV